MGPVQSPDQGWLKGDLQKDALWALEGKPLHLLKATYFLKSSKEES